MRNFDQHCYTHSHSHSVASWPVAEVRMAIDPVTLRLYNRTVMSVLKKRRERVGHISVMQSRRSGINSLSSLNASFSCLQSRLGGVPTHLTSKIFLL